METTCSEDDEFWVGRGAGVGVKGRKSRVTTDHEIAVLYNNRSIHCNIFCIGRSSMGFKKYNM